MTKAETTASIVLVVLIILGAILFFGQSALQDLSIKEQQGSENSYHDDASVYQMNEPVPLQGTGDSGVLWWDGLLELTVKEAFICDSPSSLGISNEEARFRTTADDSFSEDVAFLVCNLEVKNISATSMSPSYGGHLWFNITFLTLNPFLPITYFDGTPPNADPSGHDALAFDLAKGSSQTYTLGFVCSKDQLPEIKKALEDQSFLLLVNMASDIQTTYQFIELQVQDKRTHDE